MDPFGAVFFDRVENPGFEPLEDKAVGMLHLAITPRVSHRRIVYVDAIVLAEILELESGERGAQVGYDPIGYSEPVCDLLGELSCLGGRHSCDGFDLNPLGELVDGDEYMGETG